MKSVYILFIGIIMQCYGKDIGCGDIPPEPHCTTIHKNINTIYKEHESSSKYLQLEDYGRQFVNITELLLGPVPSWFHHGREAVVQYTHNVILVSNKSQIVHLIKNVCRMFVSMVDTLEPLKMYNSTNCTIPTIFSWLFSDKANAAIINSGVVECIEFSNVLQDIKVHNALHCDAWKSEEKIENGDVYGSID